MNYLKNCILLIILILFNSCEKEINWKMKHDNADVVVVDGIITNELKSQKIKLTHSYQDLNSIVKPYTGAIVSVSDSLSVFKFAEDLNDPGNYYSTPFMALTGKRYLLTIKTDTTTYEAFALAIPVALPEKIKIKESDGDSLFTYYYIESPSPSMTEVTYDWSFDTAYCHLFGFCAAAETYYTLNNVDVNEIFKPEKQIIKFPHGTTIIRKTYSLTEEYQEFLRSLLMETDWRGGLFDVQAGNVNTNISNGAKGFFAVCTVVTDSTTIP
jgi:hypothetical protein